MLFFFSDAQRTTYDTTTHVAQTEEPWCRLHDADTLASSQRNSVHQEHRVTSRRMNDCLPLFEKNMSRQGIWMHHSRLILRLPRIASTSNSSLCTITTMTPSAPRTRYSTRRRLSLRSSGRCNLTVLAVAVQEPQSTVSIYRKYEQLKQDMLEKDKEKDGVVWVDPERRTFKAFSDV